MEMQVNAGSRSNVCRLRPPWRGYGGVARTGGDLAQSPAPVVAGGFFTLCRFAGPQPGPVSSSRTEARRARKPSPSAVMPAMLVPGGATTVLVTPW
jgi:hypothetical protein